MVGMTDWFKDLMGIGGSAKPQQAPQRPATGANERTVRTVRPQRRGNDVLSIYTITPTSFSDAGDIAEILRSGVTVIVNVQNLNETEVRRLIDFMAGLKAGLLATSKRVAEQVYVIAPDGVEVEGDAGEVLDGENSQLIIRP